MSSWLMQPFKLEVSQELLLSSLSRTQLLLSFEKGVGHIVSDHCEYTPQQVVSQLLQAMNQNCHFLLMSGVFMLSTIQFPVFKCHMVSFLHQDPTQGAI